MPVSNINNTFNSSNIGAINNQDQNQNISNSLSQLPQAAEQLSVRREDVSLLGADFIKLRLQQSLTPQLSSLTSNTGNSAINNVTTPNTNSISNNSTNTNTQPTPLNPSLNPREVFDPQVNTFLQNTIALPPNRISDGRTVETVNSANVLQTSQLTFKTGGSFTAFYTAGFPATSTATLPRLAFDKKGITSFYKSADQLSNTQKQSVQNLYAGDLTSRKNYSVNLLNLAKNLTTLKNSGTLDNNLKNKIDSGISKLKDAYNALANVNTPSPSPRLIYSQIADVYRSLDGNNQLNQNQKNIVDTGLNILAIGASNYDTNRVPVAGTPITPAPQTPATPSQIMAAGFPLVDFDTAKNVPLSAAQANPAQTFGTMVTSYLQSVGLNNINPQNIDYQVNSADKLQFITVPLGQGRSQTVFFNAGFPVPAGTAPQVAFKGTKGVRQFLDVAQNSQQTQQQLTNFYNNPANAARRTNYGVNLQNLTSAFQQLKQAGNLRPEARNEVENALNDLQSALQQLNTGGVPNVLGLYQKLGDNLDKLDCLRGSFNRDQKDILNTLSGSLLSVGVQNYYLVPVGLSQQA